MSGLTDKEANAAQQRMDFLKSRSGWRSSATPTDPDTFGQRWRDGVGYVNRYNGKMLRALRALKGVGSVRKLRA